MTARIRWTVVAASRGPACMPRVLDGTGVGLTMSATAQGGPLEEDGMVVVAGPRVALTVLADDPTGS